VPDGMLNQFKAMNRGMLGEYIIDNYQQSGYRLVTIGAQFPSDPPPVYRPGVNTNWGGGTGSWQVDYPRTADSFWSLMNTYTPVAVMTCSRTGPNKQWRLEIGSTNLAQASWDVMPAWNVGRPPYIGGGAGDPAAPNAGRMAIAGNPPDTTIAAGTVRNAKAGVTGANSLQAAIKTALDAAFPMQPGGRAVEANPALGPQGPAPDDYVSAYCGYLAVWYSIWRGNACKAGWHTHVGYNIALADASRAVQIQLSQLITWLNAN
jgi:hypothetical protein